jgi:hypothetical protein
MRKRSGVGEKELRAMREETKEASERNQRVCYFLGFPFTVLLLFHHHF